MDSSAIATSYALTSQAQTGQAIQTEMLKMAQAQDASLIAMLEAGVESLQSNSQAAPSAGLGRTVDVTA